MLLVVAACGGGKTTTTTTPPPPPGGGDTATTGGPMPTKPDEPVGEPDTGPTKPVTQKTLAALGLDPDALDRKADPCTDFYQFACGGWIAKTEIPADKPVAMRSFVSIEDRNLEYLHGVLDKIRAKPADAVEKQLAAYYGSCMDEAAIEKAGIKPIAPMRAWIDQVKDAKSLSQTIAKFHAAGGYNFLFSMSPTQDSANAKNVIAGIDQGGLGLPDRDYYLKDDDQSKGLKAAYEGYVASMLVEMGRKPEVAKTEAAQIVALETEIAKVSKDKVARRDPKGMYNKIDKAGVAKAVPTFDWTYYWKTVGLAKVDGVDVTSPEFMAGIDKLLTSTKPEVWRAYLTFHLASRSASFLNKKLQDTQFKFISALTGQPEMEARWKRCVNATDDALGDLIGQVFVRDRFGGESKSAAENYVAAITSAMAANLDALPWMDKDTKAKAHEKLKAMSNQIGYPKKWRTYNFKLDPKTWGANALAGRKAERARQLAKIGKPVDREDWDLSAPTVNAFYNPQLNNMTFPAGILQPPFYSVEAAVPVNLGAMGVVVGHELTHGFDDQGAQFDAVGNLVNWWQPETEKLFKARTQCVVDQYSQYEVGDKTKVNGANTVGENIADIGGVKLAFAAYRQLRAPAPDTVVADGFTEDQQFFLGFGQAWCAKMRPDYEKLLATVDVHSPAKWRVNGTVSATPEFAKAFRCKAGAKMAPANRCTVW
ncbi:MAG TPA: M13 family metallopeptidase [Kofleriaceae bacterium]|nr:M13 family metallopeptidase [Kofleriaceae bacterium]